MHPVSRIELIVNSTEIKKLTKLLDKANVPGYTVFRHVNGKGEWGITPEDTAMIDLDNAYILVFCPNDQTEKLLREIQPFLKRLGGRCYTSEAQALF
jgi:nitrogen regulatory protein PII